ncbi:MAG: PGF-CTERM sorting domain-containing protein [Halolamina sp.]
MSRYPHLTTVLFASLLAALALTGAVAGAAGSAAITYDDQHSEGDSVTIQSVTLPDGGFVLVYNENSELVGHSSYLEAGTHPNVTVTLDQPLNDSEVTVAEVHRDDGNQQFDGAAADAGYTNENNNTVTDTAFIVLPEDQRDTTATETATATTTATVEETVSETAASRNTETTETSAPGFGVTVALLALLSVAAAVVRS